MVEIINKEPDRSVAKEIVCRHCGVTLRYVPADLTRYDGKDYSGGPGGCEYFDCPACKHRVVVRSW